MEARSVSAAARSFGGLHQILNGQLDIAPDDFGIEIFFAQPIGRTGITAAAAFFQYSMASRYMPRW